MKHPNNNATATGTYRTVWQPVRANAGEPCTKGADTAMTTTMTTAKKEPKKAAQPAKTPSTAPSTAPKRPANLQITAAEARKRIEAVRAAKIEDDVELTPGWAGHASINAALLALLGKLQPTQSVGFEQTMRATLAKCVTDAHTKWPDRKYTTRTTPGGVRVWRME